MSDYTPITGELRKYATVSWDPWPDARDRLYQMCDRIDAIHAGLERENAELRAARGDDWIKLPVDADGLPWHLGDVTESGQTIKAMGLNRHGWHFVGTVNEINPAIHRHHRPDTWERIIEDAIGEGMARQRNNDSGECCERANPMNNDALVARCKKLAGDAS